MAKKVHQLVDTEIKKAKSADRPYTLTDGGGLFLLISTTGSKLWRFSYYHPITKKRTKMALGFYPVVGLSKARSLRDEYKQLLANDIDPQAHLKAEKQEKLQATQNTFIAIAEQWKLKKSAEIKAATLKNHWHRLELYAFPTLADIPIAHIKPLQVTEMVTPLFKRGVNATGVSLLQTINEIYERTRGYWKTGLRRQKAKYAVAVYRGWTLAAYEISRWVEAPIERQGRWGFEGKILPKDSPIYQELVDKLTYSSDEDYKAPQNPITYRNC